MKTEFDGSPRGVQEANDWIKYLKESGNYESYDGTCDCGGCKKIVAGFEGWKNKNKQLSEGSKSRAVADCYMMAKRELSRLSKIDPCNTKSIEAWQHIIRFCEATGEKSEILRESVPKDIQGG